jgi:glycosyltransferase involved in cell wall biosynthesis
VGATTPSLRIGIVAPPWYAIPPHGYGGIERVCYYLARGLAENGHDVTLVGAGSGDAGTTFIPTYPEPASETNVVGDVLPEMVHAARSSQALGELELDVIHDHSLAGPLTARGPGPPTLITAHGPVSGEFGSYFRALADDVGLIAISESQRRSAPDLPWIATIHNALDVREYPLSEEKQDYVAFVGRMTPDKGVAEAIDATRAAGRPLVLAAKCAEEPEREYFDREVRPRLGDDVEWIEEPDADRTISILSHARCTIFPIQWREPFGMVMIESMACGTPVVALRNGSVPEVIEDGVTGFIRDDLDELPDAIERSGELDPRACRDRVAELFDVPVMVSKHEYVYRQMLTGDALGRRSRRSAEGSAARM